MQYFDTTFKVSIPILTVHFPRLKVYVEDLWFASASHLVTPPTENILNSPFEKFFCITTTI